MEAYQTYGVDASGRCTHVGINNAATMSMKTAWRIQRHWERWRDRYLREHPSEYPLRRCQPTVALVAHPVGKPQASVRYAFHAAAIADARDGGVA